MRLRPSKATDTSMTITTAIVPGGVSSFVAPTSGGLTTISRRPSFVRAANGAILARKLKYTAKPSPFANQASRPKSVAPTHMIAV